MSEATHVGPCCQVAGTSPPTHDSFIHRMDEQDKAAKYFTNNKHATEQFYSKNTELFFFSPSFYALSNDIGMVAIIKSSITSGSNGKWEL